MTGALGFGAGFALEIDVAGCGAAFNLEVIAQVANPPDRRRAAPPPMRIWRRVMPPCAGDTTNLPSPVCGASEGVIGAACVGGTCCEMYVASNDGSVNARRNSVTNACAEGGRWAGSFARPCSSTCSTAGERLGLICRGGGGGAMMCWIVVA